MLFQALKHNTVQLPAKGEHILDAQNGVVLVPQPNSKIYLHWLTDSGKLRQTYTMTYPTRVESKLKLINGLDTPTSVQVIQVG
jgi:hypothetical protein